MSESRSFHTTNPEHITYETELIRIAVLGGIRLEGLDRMRVTLKIQVEHLAIRHNLDLYNDNQTDKLIRKVAEKLEVGTSVIAAALQDLTDLLEQYRLEEIERQASQLHQQKMLNPQQMKQAKQYLAAPNLMERTKEDIGKAGVIGEEDNRLLMYLIFTSRKRDNPLHIVSLGSSGIGKTYLQEKVGNLIPEEDKMEITTLSENAFYYFERRALANKLILIEDLDGADSVLYPLRELQTKRKISKTVVHKNTKGETRTIHLQVEGPVSIAGCTTKEKLYEDNANRSFLIYVDESKQQDESIMQYQRKKSAGKIDVLAEEQMAEFFKNMQRILLPLPVRNPYAEQLILPTEVFKPRRTNAHYLAFIEAVTFYHQYQREKQYDQETGEEYVETTLEDIAESNKLLKEVLLRKSDLLTGACRNYFESLKAYVVKEGKTNFGNREIRQALRIKSTTLKRYHQQLLDAGLIQIKSGKRYKGYAYELTDPEEYKKLEQRIGSVLDEVLENLKERSPGPKVVQKRNGPRNIRKAS